MAGNLPVTTTTFESELQSKINTVGSSTSIKDIISYYRAGENIPTINNTALTDEIQLRLNAVSPSTTAEEFLALAASFGKISNTNQDDLQSALLAIADIPTNSELATALSPVATSADVSTSEANIIGAINGKSVGIPIGGVLPISSRQEMVEEGGNTYLRSGRVVEAGNTYTEIGGRFYSGFESSLFDTVVGEEDSTKICAVPEGFIFTADTTDNYISKYDIVGNQLGRISHNYGTLADIVYLQGYLIAIQSSNSSARVYDLDLNFVKNILLTSTDAQSACVVGSSLYYISDARITALKGVDVEAGTFEQYLGQSLEVTDKYSVNTVYGADYNPSTGTITIACNLVNTEDSTTERGTAEISVIDGELPDYTVRLVEWDVGGSVDYGMSILNNVKYSLSPSTSWSSIRKTEIAVGEFYEILDGTVPNYIRIK